MDDLNQLFYRHQLALLQAQLATAPASSAAHVIRARDYGTRINLFQRKRFATTGWPDPALV